MPRTSKIFFLIGLAIFGGCNSGNLSCGEGTHEQNGVCLPDGATGSTGADASTTSAPATTSGGSETTASPTTSGGGTTTGDDGTTAGATTGLDCGPGTHEEGGLCVPDDGAKYQVLVNVTEIGADGFSKIPVLVIGTNADNTPATDLMALQLSRADAGILNPSTVQLTAMGATTYFSPCNSSQSDSCLGEFTILAAKGDDPLTPVAKSQILTLVEPVGIGSPAPCLVGGNVLFFDGDQGDYIHPGVDTITLGSWNAEASAQYVRIDVEPTDQDKGLWWDVTLSTETIPVDISETVYLDAERWPFQSPGRPGLDVSGDGKGCNMLSGAFQVHEWVFNGSLLSFTATFEQHCENGSAALRGCVHYEQ